MRSSVGHRILSGFHRLAACQEHRVKQQMIDVCQCACWLPSSSFHATALFQAVGGHDSSSVDIFDRGLKRAHRDRSAFLQKGEDPLLGEVADRLLDRLEDCKRLFPTAAVLGGAGQEVISRLVGGRAGVKEVTLLDQSAEKLARARHNHQAGVQRIEDWPSVSYVEGDEEYLPLQPGSMDVIITCLGLHWVNDLPGAMTQCRRALKPDGLFLAAMWGGETLQELRIACALAEEAQEGGVSQRISPLAQVRDAGNLLTRAGFNIPSVDVDEVSVMYKDPDELVQHIRSMGESNAVHIRQPRFRRSTWEATKAAYLSNLTDEERANGAVPATYQAVYMTGWSPHPRQQRAMQRGSATASFQDLEKAMHADKEALPTEGQSKP